MSTISIEEVWTPSQADFDRFAELSGDDNPIHVDPEFSSRTRFGRTVSHGMLLYSRVFALLHRHWPGRRHDLQTMMFPNPSYAGEALAFRLTETTAEAVGIEVTRAAGGETVFAGECRLGAVAQ